MKKDDSLEIIEDCLNEAEECDDDTVVVPPLITISQPDNIYFNSSPTAKVEEEEPRTRTRKIGGRNLCYNANND